MLNYTFQQILFPRNGWGRGEGLERGDYPVTVKPISFKNSPGRASLVAQMVKNLPAMQETRGRSSRPPPLASGLGFLLPATAPYLRRGVAPLGHSCALSVSPTQSRVGSIIGATLTLRVKFAQDIPFVHDSQPAL